VAQLRVLEAENAQLKQKEWALQSCILAFEGSVAATKTVLEANESEADVCVAASSECLLSACNPATPSFSSAESSGSMRSQAGPQGSDASSSMAAQVCGCKNYSSLDTSERSQTIQGVLLSRHSVWLHAEVAPAQLLAGTTVAMYAAAAAPCMLPA
jgi:hypothetical protein